jgi:hypothetical protein
VSPHPYIESARLVTLDRVSANSEARESREVSDEGIDRPVIGASNARPLVSAANPRELVSVSDASPLVGVGAKVRAHEVGPIVSAGRAPSIVGASPFGGASASKGPYVVYTNGVHVIAHDRVTRSHWAVIVGDRRVLVARGMREVDERSFLGHASCRTCGRTRPARDFAHDEKLQGPLGLEEVVR